MAKYYKRTGIKWLAEKAAEDGVQVLPSGLHFKVIKEVPADGARSPTAADQASVTYAGQLRTGEQFDAGTISFSPNQVIAGWTEALQLMCVGDKWEVYIPYDLAYGERGSPPKIPANSPLQFQMEINSMDPEGKTCAEAREELAKKLAEKAAEAKED